MSAPREAESLRTREILAPGAVTVNQTADPGLNLLGFYLARAASSTGTELSP
jgi:hypothetical protein